MLDLSWGAVCGLYALHYLARKPGSISVKEIAGQSGLSPTFLSKMMQRLRREGLVRSARGRGYALARPPGAISVLEVVRAVDGPIAPADLCLMKNEECVFKATCPLSRVCRETAAGILSVLGGIDLQSLPTGALGLPVCMNDRKAAQGATP